VKKFARTMIYHFNSLTLQDEEITKADVSMELNLTKMCKANGEGTTESSKKVSLTPGKHAPYLSIFIYYA